MAIKKGEGMGGLVRRHKLVWHQLIVCLEHFACEGVHHRLGRKVKIAEHLVGAPAAQEANDVWVDVSDKQGRGARRPKGARRHFGGKEAEVSSDVCDRITERFGDDARSHTLDAARGEDASERRVTRSPGRSQM